MPAFDYPLETLKQYTGINPKPDDHDAYWAEALRELETVDPKAELVPNKTLSVHHAECYDLTFTGIGGARIYAKYMRPKGKTGCPAVLRFHGYTGHSGDWSDTLMFTSEGMCVAGMDCRGQGGLSEDSGVVKGTTIHGHFIRGLDDPDPRKLLFRSIFLDTVQLARVVASFEEVDESRMGATGASQGGALAIACAALEPRIKQVVAAHPFLCDYQRVWDMDLAKGPYEELRTFFRCHDPLHERKEAIFTKLGYIDIQNLAPRVQANTLMLVSLMDTICPPSTQFCAYNNLTCDKSMKIFPDFEHEFLPGMNDYTLNGMLQL
jgi:cephalosporin-C deacetylase